MPPFEVKEQLLASIELALEPPQVLADKSPVALTRAVVVAEFVTVDSRALSRLGLDRGGSDLAPWDSSGLLIHSLKEVLYP